MSKYYNTKCIIDGVKFDSIKEAERYRQLQLLQRAGKISELQRQVRFELIPAQYEETGELYKSGPRKGQPKPGRCIEHAVAYVADFVYTESGRLIVEDTKGIRTKDYIIKRKLFKQLYGDQYEFREV